MCHHACLGLGIFKDDIWDRFVSQDSNFYMILKYKVLKGENYNPSLKYEAKFTQDQNYMLFWNLTFFSDLNNIEKELYEFPLKQHTADIWQNVEERRNVWKIE